VTRAVLAGALALVLLPLNASAQSASDAVASDKTTPDQAAQAPAAASQGPMIVERIHSGVLFAPEAKATRFDDQIKPLVGGSIGWVAEEALFFGGGGFWMPETGHSDRELAYGGFVFQWFALNNDHFGLSAKALLGGGTATLPQLVTQFVYPAPVPDPRTGRPVPVEPRPVTSTVHVHEDFLVAEPEVNARIAFSRHVRLALGAGYRFAGNDWWHYYYSGSGRNDHRLSGATVTFGLQIGG
jgi:hypothetical protein